MISRTVDISVWHQEGQERFGRDSNRWLFRCPSCGQVQCGADIARVIPDSAYTQQLHIGHNCIGSIRPADQQHRVVEVLERSKGHGCRYRGDMPNSFNPVRVRTREGGERRMFEWADEDWTACATCLGDRVLCTVCRHRPVSCICKHGAKLGDCPECMS